MHTQAGLAAPGHWSSCAALCTQGTKGAAWSGKAPCCRHLLTCRCTHAHSRAHSHAHAQTHAQTHRPRIAQHVCLSRPSVPVPAAQGSKKEYMHRPSLQTATHARRACHMIFSRAFATQAFAWPPSHVPYAHVCLRTHMCVTHAHACVRGAPLSSGSPVRCRKCVCSSLAL